MFDKWRFIRLMLKFNSDGRFLYYKTQTTNPVNPVVHMPNKLNIINNYFAESSVVLNNIRRHHNSNSAHF